MPNKLLSTQGWIEVKSQEDMDMLFNQIYSFHDGLLKEFHVINRGYIESDLSMVMDHSFDGIFHLQTQFKPGSILILLFDIFYLHVESATEYFDGSGEYHTHEDDHKNYIHITAEDLEIKAKKLFYRVTEEMLGKKSFLGLELPAQNMAAATLVEENMRQCGHCANIWPEDTKNPIALCPECKMITMLKTLS